MAFYPCASLTEAVKCVAAAKRTAMMDVHTEQINNSTWLVFDTRDGVLLAEIRYS